MSERVLRGQIGLYIILVLIAVPLAFWLLVEPISERFESTFATLSSISQIAGILGMALFSVTLILSARLSFFEDYFGGLDRMYNLHHTLGTLAFVMLMVHPILLAVRMIPLSVPVAAQSLIPGTDVSIDFGIYALLLMMGLLSVTFYAKWRYQALRFTHTILGIAFLLGFFHLVSVDSDVSESMTLRVYMIALALCAVIAYGYRTLFGKFCVKRYRYIVTGVNDLGLGVTEVVMHPEGERLHHFAGQFIFISFRDPALNREVHPFTISSAPHEKLLRITVKGLGDWTKLLSRLSVGSVAYIEGPFGHFSYQTGESVKQIWIAGGIGVTPFLSMLRSIRVGPQSEYAVDFYYATKTPDEVVFRNEIESITREHPHIKFIPFSASEHGFITADAVQKMSDVVDKDIFVCGPPPMMHGLVTGFQKLGVPERFMRTEEFKLL